jgi:hypothetical protein
VRIESTLGWGQAFAFRKTTTISAINWGGNIAVAAGGNTCPLKPLFVYEFRDGLIGSGCWPISHDVKLTTVVD